MAAQRPPSHRKRSAWPAQFGHSTRFPALAQAPPSLLATVFVFKNGVRGGGPFKYQPDVFDNPPGTEGYRPLRALALVTWKNEQAARVLKSEREVKAAEQAGEVVIERPGVVVDMPLVTWPGGRR